MLGAVHTLWRLVLPEPLEGGIVIPIIQLGKLRP